ncbi:MAG: hypothetical protein GX250_07360 [Clostridiales bacterium]|jgi:hypothetical protein|nr:hypothetical protein [Clostridiales bacterium]
MNSKPKRIILRISSVLMLLAALPLMLWCWYFFDVSAIDRDLPYASVGCFAAGIVYVFSMVTAIAGLVFAGKPYRYRWCRTFGYIQLVAGLILIIPMLPYALFTLPPLYLLTVIYLSCVGWREKWDYEQ